MRFGLNAVIFSFICYQLYSNVIRNLLYTYMLSPIYYTRYVTSQLLYLIYVISYIFTSMCMLRTCSFTCYICYFLRVTSYMLYYVSCTSLDNTCYTPFVTPYNILYVMPYLLHHIRYTQSLLHLICQIVPIILYPLLNPVYYSIYVIAHILSYISDKLYVMHICYTLLLQPTHVTPTVTSVVLYPIF